MPAWDGPKEGEYIGQFNAAREATWIRLFLEELGFGDLVQKATTIYADSNGARALAENPTSHSKAKHMEIKYYWQRQQVEHGVLRYHYVPSKQNAADGLTKPLGKQDFENFRLLINLTNG